MSNIEETVKKGLEAVKEKTDESISSVKTEVDKKVSAVEDDLEAIQAKMKEQAQNSGAVEEETKKQCSYLEKQLTALKERQDALESENGRLRGKSQKGFKDHVRKALTDNQDQIKNFIQTRQQVSIPMKEYTPEGMTKATMLESTHFSGEVVEPTRVPGVKFNPDRRIHVRQFLPQGTTSSNAIWYNQETAYTDNMSNVAEGATKPESDITITQQQAPVVKIATHFDVSEEMLEDADFMSSHIAMRGTSKYFNKEDNDLLYGTGTSNQVEGLTVSATDYQLDQYTGDSNAQEYDVLLEANKQILNDNFNPTANMVSITDFFSLLRRKDTDGRYILPPGITFDNGVLRVLGNPIIPTNALNDGDFLVADFPQLTTLFDRRGVSVRLYDQNEDNAITNLVTVVIEARLALPTFLPDAGRFGNFATAITNAGNS